jgi:hypothetical protein
MAETRDPTPARQSPHSSSSSSSSSSSLSCFLRYILPPLILIISAGCLRLIPHNRSQNPHPVHPNNTSNDLPPPSFTPLLILPPNSTELPLLRVRGESDPPDYKSGCRYWFSIQQTDVNHVHAKKAFSYYHRAAEAGLGLGNLLLGNAYQVGYGTLINIAKSVENYRNAMKRGDLDG